MKLVKVYKEAKLVARLEGFGTEVDVIEQIECRDSMDVGNELIKSHMHKHMYYRGDTVFVVTECDNT